jgi:orotate phosphoribosyltransferase
MIDPQKANELINQYFSSSSKSQIIKDLQKYDFSKLAEKDIEEKKKALVELIIRDGKLLPKERVVIVDEVLTTGTNIINAVEYIRQDDDSVNVSDAFVFINRANKQELNNIENQLKDLKVNLHYIININELFEELKKRQVLTSQEIEIIKKDLK